MERRGEEGGERSERDVGREEGRRREGSSEQEDRAQRRTHVCETARERERARKGGGQQERSAEREREKEGQRAKEGGGLTRAVRKGEEE